MASSALSIAAPMAVPDDVDRLSIAFVRARRSVVGGTASWACPAKMTRPVRVPGGCCSTKSSASCWATVIRLGLTSVAHMDRDTSRARMTEVCEADTVRVRWGRAAPTARTPMLSQEESHRQMALPPGAPGEHRAQQGYARVAHRLPASPPQAEQIDAEQQGYGEKQQQGEGPGERHLTPASPSSGPTAPRRGQAVPRRRLRTARSPRCARRRS